MPKGFVGRRIAYAVFYDGIFYGYTVAGSATLHLPGRNEYFGIDKSKLNQIVNNTFFHIEKANSKYPIRNFVPYIISEWRKHVVEDWEIKYKDKVIGFETLVELPRNGDCYKRDGWVELGQTQGFTCKRTAGKGTDSWTGKRIWDTENLRTKLVLAHKL